MKNRSAQPAAPATLLAIFSPNIFSPSRRISFRSLLRLDSGALRLFALRILYGALYGAGFCAWLYAFALLCSNFTLESTTLDSSTTLQVSMQILCLLGLSMLVLCAFWIWLSVPKVLRAYFGFFAGILLFYWIGLSFRFSVAPALMPVVWIGVGTIYALLWYVGLYFSSKLFRIVSLFALGLFAPFGFDWFVPQSWLAYSIFSVQDWAFIAILCAIGIICSGFSHTRFSYVRVLFGVGILLVCVDWDQSAKHTITHPVSSKIAIIESSIDQDVKWKISMIEAMRDSVLGAVDSAIAQGRDLVIFPETILPLVLNEPQSFQRDIILALLEKSAQITIVLGAFSQQDSLSSPNATPEVRNSTYIFSNGKMRILHKVILAPFGEKIPLPDILAKPLYKLFFGIDVPLGQAEKPQDFEALGRIWRNAICYEGTSKLLYTNAPQYLMMISNNAWFYPSIEPYLQRVLLKYYARKFGTLIVHSANLSSAMMISPVLFGDSRESVMPLTTTSP